MSDASDLTLFPAWRQAVRDLLSDFAYGDIVPHAWLEQRFGMPQLNESQQLTAAEFSKRQFDWLQNIEAFKDELLREHNVCLQSVRGEGYRWVPPGEQSRVAMDSFEKNAKRVFATAAQRLRNVRVDELTDEQRKENSDSIAKLASLRGMTRRQLG
jgi:hypothetical protein